MRSLNLIPSRWLDYEPPGLCHTGIEELAALGASAAAAAGEAAGTAATAVSAWAPSLATVGEVAGVAGTGLSTIAGIQNASYQSDLAKTEAQLARQKANDDAAAGERQQTSRDRQTDYMLSRVRAGAAASGTDAASPDVVNTEGEIAQQGEYNAQSALYEGMSRERADNYQGDIDLFKANRIDGAIPLQATGTLLSGLGSFADRRVRRNYLLSTPNQAGY